MRQRPQDLGGPTTTTPQASLVDTFAPSDVGLNSRNSVAPQLVDFSSLSNTLGKLAAERKEFNETEGAAVGERVAQERRKNPELTDEELIRAAAADKATPRTIASRLAKLAKQGKINEVDLPGFQLGLESSRGEFVAAQVAETAQAKEAETAAKIALLASGDTKGANAIFAEALQEISEANQDDTEGLSALAARAASPLLGSISDKFIENVRSQASELRKEERDAKSSVVTHSLGKAYSGAKSGAEEQTALDGLGGQIAKLKLEGHPDAKGKVVDDAIKYATVVYLKDGAAAAEKFLGDVLDRTTMPSGAAAFRDNPPLRLLEALDQAKFKAEREEDKKPLKLAQQQKNAEISHLNSEGNRELLNVIAQGDTDAVLTYRDNALAAIESGDPDVLEKYGFTPENAKYARKILNDSVEAAFGSAQNFSNQQLRSKRNEILAVYLSEGYDAALASIGRHGLRADQQIQVLDELSGLKAKDSDKAFGILSQYQVISDIKREAESYFAEDDPLAKVAADEAVSEFIEYFTAGDHGKDFGHRDAIQVRADFLKVYRERHAQDSEDAAARQAALEKAGGDPNAASKILARPEQLQNSVGLIQAGESQLILGGVQREGAPEDLLEFEEYLAASRPNKVFKSYRDVSVGAKRINDLAAGKGVPSDLRNAAVLDGTARLTLVPILALSTGNLDTIKGAIAKRLEEERSAQGKSRFAGVGQAGDLGLLHPADQLDLEGWDDLDISKLNPFLIPFPDLKDAAEYLIVDPSDSSKAAWNPDKPLGDHMRFAIEELLEATGLTADDKTIKTFLKAQHSLWRDK